MRPPDPRVRAAREGEDLAVVHLRWRGFEILERNWRCRAGEIDIVARDGATLVFVEVKARTSRAAGPPEEGVTVAKRRRLVHLAKRFLMEKGLHEIPCRFDVVAVEVEDGRRPEIRHHVGAFRADGS